MERKEIPKESKMPGAFVNLEILRNEYVELGVNGSEIRKWSNEDEEDYLERAITTHKLHNEALELGLELEYNFNINNESEITYYRRKIKEHKEYPIINYGGGRLTFNEDDTKEYRIKAELKLKKMLLKHDRLKNESNDAFYARIEKKTFLGSIIQDDMGEISGDITTSEQLSGRYLLDAIAKDENRVKEDTRLYEYYKELEEEGYSFDRKDQNDNIKEFIKKYEEKYFMSTSEDERMMQESMHQLEDKEGKYVTSTSMQYDAEGNSRKITVRAAKGEGIGEYNEKTGRIRIDENTSVDYNPGHMDPFKDILNRKKLNIDTSTQFIQGSTQSESPMYLSGYGEGTQDRFTRPSTPSLIKKKAYDRMYDFEKEDNITDVINRNKKKTKKNKIIYASVIICIIFIIIMSIVAGHRHNLNKKLSKLELENTRLIEKEIKLEAKGINEDGPYEWITYIRPGIDSNDEILRKIRAYETYVANINANKYEIIQPKGMYNLVKYNLMELEHQLDKKQIVILTISAILICTAISAISIGILAIKIYIIIKIYQCVTGKNGDKRKRR